MLKTCENCVNSVWRDGKSAVTEVCLACKSDKYANPSNWKLKPMTNADRIRAMSDEELAAWIDEWCHNAVDCQHCPMKNCSYRHNLRMNEWLKQPAEEDSE